jgi:hypothetical protein
VEASVGSKEVEGFTPVDGSRALIVPGTGIVSSGGEADIEASDEGDNVRSSAPHGPEKGMRQSAKRK